MREPSTSTGALARLGFQRTDRVQRFLNEPALQALPDGSAEALGSVPDGDEAILGLLRLAEAAEEQGHTQLLTPLLREVPEPGSAGHALAQLMGTSVALGDFLTRHPEELSRLQVTDPLSLPAEKIRDRLLTAVGADPAATVPVAGMQGREARDALRVAYMARVVEIAVADVTSADPLQIQPEVSAALSDLAGAALEAALAIARTAVDGHEQVRLAVIAMGKTGARELNYISDVDVMYVVAPAVPDGAAADPAPEADVITVGAALCRELARVCADRTAEGSLWQVDANLRPEGQDGPLVRTIDSYRRYYAKWAHSWEFQALLKARPAAGDPALSEEFAELVEPLVWQASTREGFVEDTRAMRRRVIAHIPRHEVDRNLKLGPGGLRDVEFTVQMLQMVHGRTDETIHARTTLGALTELVSGGYISREHGARLDEGYRFLRSVEHRLQLHRLRRTQVIATADADIRRLARSLHIRPKEFSERYDTMRRQVRHLHEQIYYRPLLSTAASLSDDEVRLSPEAAQERLAAIGYRDPRQAMRHIEALTDGVSRTAQIQRQLLPALLAWFADGIDPDAGLLAFRRLSDKAGHAHWYMRLLRDSGVAAQRLTRVLSSSRFIGDTLEHIPEGVRWLARDETLQPLSRAALHGEFSAVIRRAFVAEEATTALRRARQRELLRIAMGLLLGVIDPQTTARGLTDLADAVLEAGMLVAYHVVAQEQQKIGTDVEVIDSEARAELDVLRERRSDPARRLGIEMAVIAMGSFGAREMGFSSDADVQFVVADRGAGNETAALGVAVASQVQKILNAPSAGTDMKISADLRPEGRNGVLARTVDSWRDYLRRDAETWEKQALLRARVVLATPELDRELTSEMDRHRYPEGGLSAAQRRDIVRMKARVEGERLPRGADPARHLKLGRGAMTDVEWTVQLLTMDHAHEHSALRTPTTLEGLSALVDAELLGRRDAEELADAWKLAWQLRRTVFLWKGREGSILPTDRVDLPAVAHLIDGEDGTANELEDRYLRTTRHARSIVERIIFGDGTS